MHPPKNTHKLDRTFIQAALVVWSLGLLGVVLAVIFNIAYYRRSFLEARAYQQQKVEEVSTRIRHFFYVATQLANTLQTLVENNPGQRKEQVERFIDLMVASAPSDLVYGAGVWWEPYGFDSKTRLFGPYVHRELPGHNRVLSYDWDNETYYYPRQPWYQKGFEQTTTPYVTDPYFDRGVGYITVAKPFFDQISGHKKGVITVGMILPQLQNIVNDANTKSFETVSLIGKTGKILAYPKPQELLNLSRRLHPGKSLENVLDVAAADSLVGHEHHLIHSVYLQELGWTVLVISNPDVILANYYRVRNFIIMATAAYLLVLFASFFLIRYFLRSLAAQRESFLYAEKLASLGEMAGGIAHEINNPLAIIQGAAHKLQIRLKHEEFNREDVRQTVGIILKTAERIARIIRSLRFVARDGSMDPFVNTNIRAIVDETLVLCEAKIKHDNVQLETTAPEELFCVCRGVQISQILINLLNNAIDAIRDQPSKWIRLEAFEQDEIIRIVITDSGPGIPAALADQIMKPFFTTKEVGKGTGLGLSISRGIAQAHGGDLELDRQSPNTRFVLTLPRAQENRQTA